ncbi:MAG: hypothetical protein N3A58_04970 [Spirochaetes bacterium]|nr:hypothetical protein [Spirochaetota bacterium]
MIVEEQLFIEKKELIKNSKIIIFNDFKENSSNFIENCIIENLVVAGEFEILRENNMKEFEKEFDKKIIGTNIFELKKIFFIKGNPDRKILSLINKVEDDYKFIFFTENFTNEDIVNDKNIIYIIYPKYINLNSLISGYFKRNNLFIENENVEYILTFFINYTVELGVILQNIKIYCLENNIRSVTKDIINKFLYLSGEIYIYQLVDFLYKKKKVQFFNLYFNIASNIDGFYNLFYYLINDVKRLIVVGEFIIKERNKEENLIEYLNKIGINYNRFRIKYDIEKINSFGLNRMYKLLSFLIYINYLKRIYYDELIKNIFESYICSFIE